MTHLLLASKSPRRRELVARLGLPFTVVDIDVEERLPEAVEVSQVAVSLARLKAEGYNGILTPETVLVTADTVVVHRGKVLGKPQTAQQAAAMLQSLSGDSHQVYTGVCLRTDSRSIHFMECTQVYFRDLSKWEIDYYVDRYRPYDKAGAYGIQEWVGMVGVERIDGCYYNVMGLPVVRLYKELQGLVDLHSALVD